MNCYLDSERAVKPPAVTGSRSEQGDAPAPAAQTTRATGDPQPKAASKPKRFHGTAVLNATRVGRDASRIAEEVIAHLAGLVGARVTVTIEIEAEIPDGAPDHVVRTVTENSRTLKFSSHGFERE